MRKQRYEYQPNDMVLYENKKYPVVGTHCNGQRVLIKIGKAQKSVAINKLRKVGCAGGWTLIEK